MPSNLDLKSLDRLVSGTGCRGLQQGSLDWWAYFEGLEVSESRGI